MLTGPLLIDSLGLLDALKTALAEAPTVALTNGALIWVPIDCPDGLSMNRGCTATDCSAGGTVPVPTDLGVGAQAYLPCVLSFEGTMCGVVNLATLTPAHIRIGLPLSARCTRSCLLIACPLSTEFVQ
jgi:hypothetical protein